MSSNNDQSDASGDSSPVTATTPASSSPPRAESETKAQELPILSSWKQRKKSQATADQIREAKASMRTVLEKVTALSNKIREESSVLGHVGRDLENRPLGKLKMAKQPKILTGGVLTPHQREALTWMYYIAQQSISGILADEMGLGKTISTIAFIARLRETDAYYGPFLIAAPLSTLSNWIAEFRKWAPSIPVVQYHGSRAERDEIFRRDIKSKLSKKRQATEEFPVVCTSYEMVLADVSKLKTIPFEIIIVVSSEL